MVASGKNWIAVGERLIFIEHHIVLLDCVLLVPTKITTFFLNMMLLH